jgi:DNA sulfur modification protein DndE
MARKIKLSSGTERLNLIRSRLDLPSRDYLHTLRIAFAVSLQSDRDFDESSDILPKTGFEIEVPTFEQNDAVLIRCLLQQKYQAHLDDRRYEDLLRLHIEHGLQMLIEDTEKFRGYEYLAQIAQRGLKDAGIPEEASPSANPPGTYGFTDLLLLPIGINKSDRQPFSIRFNKFDEHPNCHIGVVGTTGSGKTYFIKYLLTKLREVSQFKTNFIFFDYKGDVFGDDKFIRETKAEVWRVMQSPLPINIFRGTDPKKNAERVLELVRGVEANIGKVQEDNLYRAILDAYERATVSGRKYPDFHMVRDALSEIRNSPDSLTSVFRPLTEHNLFARYDQELSSSLIDKTIVIDIHDLPACKELSVFFTLEEMYRELKGAGNSRENPDEKTREIRTVIVLDEAHYFLKSKSRVSILEKMIREIRSMGAAVILISQSPEDFDQSDFNFMELLEFVYVLRCTPDSNRFLKQYFSLSGDKANQLMREVAELKTGEAVTRGPDKNILRLELCSEI